jgi:hypothetical protein
MLRPTPPNTESSNEAAPSWMPGTLDNSALMKEASKCFETLQEYRSGYGNLVGEVSDPDSRWISLDLRNTESQDVLLATKSSQAVADDLMMITLQETLKMMVEHLQVKPKCWNAQRPS